MTLSPEEREIRVEGDVAYITLTKGYEAIIDAADVSLVGGRNWHAKPYKHAVYAARSKWVNGRDLHERLHRLIANAPDGMDVDHIDGDGLNNRRANLRIATRSENCCNQRLPEHSTSGLKGANWKKEAGKWRAQIAVRGRKKHLGYFATPEAAHEAYLAAAEKLHGDFANLNPEIRSLKSKD